MVVGGASLVIRFRRARGEERQQLRWVASAAVVAAVGIPVTIVGNAIESAAVVGVAMLGSAAVLCLAVAARSCAIGCMTWTASSAGPSPTRC